MNLWLHNRQPASEKQIMPDELQRVFGILHEREVVGYPQLAVPLPTN